MALTEECSSVSMPGVLVVVTTLLLCARVGFLFIPEQAAAGDGISWSQVRSEPVAAVKAPVKPVDDVERVSPFTEEQLAKISDAARNQSKMILFQFDSLDSDSCERMERVTMSNKEIENLVESRFVPVRVTDRTRSGVKNSRVVSDLHRKYKIFAYPTLVVADQSGARVISMVGNCSSLTTYRFLTRALSNAGI